MVDQETGLIFVVLGIVFMVVGIFFLPICGVGLILLIIGIVLMISTPSAPTPMYTPYYPPPGTYSYPSAPAPPPGAPPAPQAPAAPVCPVCAGALTWMPQYQRWYCYRCQAYR